MTKLTQSLPSVVAFLGAAMASGASALFLVLASSAAVPSLAAAADLAKGKVLYESLCVSCHGVMGLGDGPVGAALPPAMKPNNLQTGVMKYATDDVKFAELLKKGGAAVGLNALMPAQPQLTAEEAKNIIAFVHSLVKK